MKKKLLSLCLGGLVAAMTCTASAEMVVSLAEGYGNHMGTTTDVQSYDNTFYNAEGKIVRRVVRSAGTTGEMIVKNVYYYTYDNNDRLVRMYNEQWSEAKSKWSVIDDIAYEYDEQGRLVSETGGSATYQYTYDDMGNILTKKHLVTATGQEIQNLTYSDFIEGTINKPRKVKADGAYSNYVYDGTFEYDDQNRLIAESQFSTSGSKMSRTEYTYDVNGVKLNEVYMTTPSWNPSEIEAGSEADTLRYFKCIVRTPLGNDIYERKEYLYYVDDILGTAEWETPTSYVKEHYVDAESVVAPTTLSLVNVSTDETPNTVKITAVTPVGIVENAEYVIWRNYEPIATVQAVDGAIEYVDSNVASGVQTYFVQYTDVATGMYHGVTDLATIDMSLDLAPVTNLRLIGGYKGTYSDAQHAEYETFYIKLAWDAPICDYPVLGYKIYEKPFVIPTGEVAGDVCTFDANVPDLTSADFRVDVVYEFGTVVGEWVSFTWDNTADFEIGENDDDTAGELLLVLKDGNGVKEYYMYDNLNNIYRSKANVSTNNDPLYQYYYNYTDGALTEYYFTQYKDLGEWTDPKNHTFYTYDDQGRLASADNTIANRLKEYFYDEQGRLVKMTDKGKSNVNSDVYDKLYATYEYSGFDANNNPARLDYTDGIYASGSYYTLFTYDEKGRCISEVTYYTSSDVAWYKYEYEYDNNDICVNSVKSNAFDGEFTYAVRETRTTEDGKIYNLTIYNYSERSSEWTVYRTYTEYYAELKGAYAPRNLVVTDASTADAPNSIALTCDVPATEVPNAQYIIWRNSEQVAVVEAVDGKITFTESGLTNAEHEYFVQSYDAVNNVYYNISNAETVVFGIELPIITNLHYIKTTEGFATDMQGGQMPCYWVHFAWDAPETDLAIEGYNIYDAGWTVPQKMAANTCDSVSVYREATYDHPDQQREVAVEVTVVYSLGESERVAGTFVVEQTAVEEATVACAYVAGDYLVTDATCEVALYNVSGVKVAEYSNQSRIDLAQLPTGVYVARIEQNGKVQTIKIAR